MIINKLKVVLKTLSVEDIDVLEGFFSKSFHGQKSVTVSAENFKRALKNNCFDLVELKELLENYFREKMTGKKERRQNEEEKLRNIFEKNEVERVIKLSAEIINAQMRWRIQVAPTSCLTYKPIKQEWKYILWLQQQI